MTLGEEDLGVCMEVYMFTSKFFYQLWSLGYPSSILDVFSLKLLARNKWSWLECKLERSSWVFTTFKSKFTTNFGAQENENPTSALKSIS